MLPHAGNGTLAGPPTHPSELPPLAAASMWTRKDVQEFKASLNGDAEGTFTVGSGECVTVSQKKNFLIVFFKNLLL